MCFWMSQKTCSLRSTRSGSRIGLSPHLGCSSQPLEVWSSVACSSERGSSRGSRWRPQPQEAVERAGGAVEFPSTGPRLVGIPGLGDQKHGARQGKYIALHVGWSRILLRSLLLPREKRMTIPESQRPCTKTHHIYMHIYIYTRSYRWLP